MKRWRAASQPIRRSSPFSRPCRRKSGSRTCYWLPCVTVAVRRAAGMNFAAPSSTTPTPYGRSCWRARRRPMSLRAVPRCCRFLPVCPQPLALIEVGASAGLCLLPDFYGYDYGGQLLYPPGAVRPQPVFPCTVDAKTPIPAAMPQIGWRAGLDLNPLDVSDPEQAAWLRTLVWPAQTDRLARLSAAMQIVAANKPRLVAGDLRHDLAILAADAPKGATLVIFHTAVLAS